MTDPTAAVEVWARMLCAADVHVNDGDHIAWQELPRLMQNDYRKAAQWLLPRLTVGQPAAVPTEPADAGLRDRIAQALEEADYRPDMRRGDLADAIMPVLPARTDRAAVLREAADAIVAENDRQMWATKPGKHWAADLLRRLADEAQQAGEGR